MKVFVLETASGVKENAYCPFNDVDNMECEIETHDGDVISCARGAMRDADIPANCPLLLNDVTVSLKDEDEDNDEEE